MSKFCGNCGTQLPDEAVVCSNCGINLGAPAPAPAAAPAGNATAAIKEKTDAFVGKMKSDKKFLGIVIGAAALVLVLIVVLIFCLFGGGNEALDNYFEAKYDGDYDSYLATKPEEYWDDDNKVKESTFNEGYEDDLKAFEKKYGDDISWSYNILKEKDLPEGKFNKLAKKVADAWNVRVDDVDDAMTVWFEYTIEGDDEDAIEDDVAERNLVKVDGTWYIWEGYWPTND